MNALAGFASVRLPAVSCLWPRDAGICGKAVRLALAVMLIAGAGLTARAAYLHAKAVLAGILIRDAWEETARTGVAQRPWPWADTHPIARLSIPRLGYDEIVLEGATPRTLAFGPARLRSAVAPDEPGNLVLAGHRTSWFRRLESLAAGDRIELEWYDSRHTGGLRAREFTVQQIHIVTPDDVSLLGPTADDALTLVTCYPFGRGPTSPLRFVVRATPLGPTADKQRAATRAIMSTAHHGRSPD